MRKLLQNAAERRGPAGRRRKHENMDASLTAECLPTTGEIFGESGILDVVSDVIASKQLNLVFWNGREVTIGPRLRCMDRVYEAATIDPGILRLLRLPKRAMLGEPAEQLLSEISDCIQRYSGLDWRHCDARRLFCACELANRCGSHGTSAFDLWH